MERQGIPGMAVGIAWDGHSHVFTFGVASRATGRPIESGTLFEVGSVSKTFTATLAAYAQIEGALALSDPVAKYLPVLRDSPSGQTTLLRLGTHTAGRLPLPVPDEVTNEDGGNSAEIILETQPVTPLDPPSPPRDDVLINKTGSTKGFSTCVAFVPARRMGVVLLANKRYPIDARVKLAYEILTRLADNAR